MSEEFVSRAGQKLAHALTTFKIDLTNKVCADFGCSTGGFTDCMLRNGAQKVYSIDTGYGVLDWKLRNNPQVVVMERTNAMHVELPEKVDFITIDTSWTKQKFVLPQALKFLKEDCYIVSLLKPHYEAERSWLVAGKVKPEYLEACIEKVKKDLEELKVKLLNIEVSPILGKQGENVEYLMYLTRA
ncbi:MAG: SAM-dependent methyltransferase [Patescibacteria group bacterium]